MECAQRVLVFDAVLHAQISFTVDEHKSVRQLHSMIKPILSCFKFVKLIALGIALTLLPGCAAKRAYVCARTNPRHHPDSTHTYAIASHSIPRPDDELLRQFLEAELRSRGFRIVSQAQADYTFAFWFDDAWLPAKRLVYGDGSPYSPPPPTVHAPFSTPPSGGTVIMRVQPRNPADYMPHVVDDPYPVHGIRLKLYPGGSSSTNQLQTIWDGYIDAGSRLPAKLQPVLIQRLLDYFGKEFVGKIKLKRE